MDQPGSGLNVPVEYLPPELKGLFLPWMNLRSLLGWSVSIDRRMHQTPLLKYLSKGRIVAQINLGMFILYLSRQDVREETIGRRSS